MGSLIVQPEPIVLAPGERWKSPAYAEEAIKATFGRQPLWKVDEQTHTVYGLSTAELPDSDREVADYVDSARYYMLWGDETSKRTRDAGQEVSFGNIRYQHTGQIAGAVRRINLMPEKRAIWLLTQPVDDDIWRQLVGGFLTGYSHAGKYAYRRCFDCGYDLPAGHYCPQCHKESLVRYAPILTEVSYVDRPCLKDAVFAYVKSDGSTEMRKFVAPAAKKVLVDVRELAEQHAAAFMQAIENLGKQARTEAGQFSNNVSGPEHDALVSGGFEHKTTCEGGARIYQHPGGSKVTLGQDGAWEHDDGAGRISSGVGSQAIAIHLAACTKAAADSAGKDTTTMEDAAVKDLIKTGIVELLSSMFGVTVVDGKLTPVDLPAKKVKKEYIECPGCGEDVDLDPEDGEDSMECPECGREISLKSRKAFAVPALTAATHKQGEHLMKVEELLNKAATGLKAFFAKSATYHEKMVAVHKGLADEHTASLEKAADADKPGVEKQANFHKSVAAHHQNLLDACKEAVDAFGTEDAKADTPVDLTKAIGDTQTALSAAIDEKLAPITKALGALDGIATLGERLANVETMVEKFGNETLPTMVKGAGAGLINREGKRLDPPSASTQSASGGLFS